MTLEQFKKTIEEKSLELDRTGNKNQKIAQRIIAEIIEPQLGNHVAEYDLTGEERAKISEDITNLLEEQNNSGSVAYCKGHK